MGNADSATREAWFGEPLVVQVLEDVRGLFAIEVELAPDRLHVVAAALPALSSIVQQLQEVEAKTITRRHVHMARVLRRHATERPPPPDAGFYVSSSQSSCVSCSGRSIGRQVLKSLVSATLQSRSWKLTRTMAP
jgi:hypothetical protein